MPRLNVRFAVVISLVVFSLLNVMRISRPVLADDATPWSASADQIEKFSQRPGGFNYVESSVPEYTLPDPLTMSDGTPVGSAGQWNERRRAELMELFRHHVYGRRPQAAYDVRFEMESEVSDAFHGTATARSMKVIIEVDDRTFSYPFSLFIPKDRQGKVPAVVLINNRYFIPIETAMSEEDPFWPAKTIIKRGYATATFHTSHVDPDRKDGYAEGIRSFFAGGAPPADDAWRALSAWGWGASRVLDYLETLDAVDADRVAVLGHSRGGKSSLWAAAEDPRFAIGYSNNSGCGGAALSRRAYGETVARITSSFPHWFCKNFSGYAGREQDLPVDQHQLISLIAPRGVYVTSADQDLWADPRGEYLSLVAAAPVFQLLGQQAITNPAMPPMNAPRVVGKAGYHIRSGGHGLELKDWNYFLDYADTLLK